MTDITYNRNEFFYGQKSQEGGVGDVPRPKLNTQPSEELEEFEDTLNGALEDLSSVTAKINEMSQVSFDASEEDLKIAEQNYRRRLSEVQEAEAKKASFDESIMNGGDHSEQNVGIGGRKTSIPRTTALDDIGAVAAESLGKYIDPLAEKVDSAADYIKGKIWFSKPK